MSNVTTGDVTIEGPRFAQMPEALLYDPEVTPTAKVIYGVLLRHGENPANCFPSHERIASLVGISWRSVNRFMVELEKAGWVSRIHRRNKGAFTSCSYIVRTAIAHHSATVIAQDSATTIAQDSATNDSHVKESQEKPSRPADAEQDRLYGFDFFWETYPKRNGRRIGRGLCEKRWVKLSLGERRDAYRGALNYAKDCDLGLTIAKDPDRWLRDRLWQDWQLTTPVKSTTVTTPEDPTNEDYYL